MQDWLPSPGNALIILLALWLSFISLSKIKSKGAFLCEDCRFNREDLCNKNERPHATQCTSYRQGEVQPLPIAAGDGEKAGEGEKKEKGKDTDNQALL